MPWYCLFCKAGQEQNVIRMLEERGARPLAPLVVHLQPGEKGLERARRRLLPGYVFFEQEETPDWPGIIRYSSVLKILHYQDETPELRGADLDFVTWLKQYEGLIDVSEVVKVGTKIAFVSGCSTPSGAPSSISRTIWIWSFSTSRPRLSIKAADHLRQENGGRTR